MKVIKNIGILLFFIAFTSCNKTDSDSGLAELNINYDSLKAEVFSINSVSQMVDENETFANEMNNIFSTKETSEYYAKKPANKGVVYVESDLSDVYSNAQKTFLASFYNELGNSKDGYILDIVSKYKDVLNTSGLSVDEYEQTLIVLLSAEQVINIFDQALNQVYSSKNSYFSKEFSRNGFGDCMAEAGTNIGRGIAAGALTGAVRGGLAGAAGGTVAFPGLGTATGAVGGAVFGAAAGALYGGVTAAAWSAVDCGIGGGIKEFLGYFS